MEHSRRTILAMGGWAALVAASDPFGLVRSTAAASPRSGAVPAGSGLAGSTRTGPAPAGPALTTVGKTVRRDPAAGNGYATLVARDGESHLLRTIYPDGNPPVTRPLIAFAQMTDLHITDVRSPLRVEFMDAYDNSGPPHYNSWGTDSAYRAHEMLSTQLTDAVVRAIRNVGKGPKTGLPLALTLVTGDAVDNCQFNEARWYINLLDGGSLRPDSGWPGRDESVSGPMGESDPTYYHPENLSDANYYRGRGFHEVHGLIDAARRPFRATGLGMPWYAAFGNHDGLVQGNLNQNFGEILQDELLNGIATGGKKLKSVSGLPDVRPTSIGSAVFYGIKDLVTGNFGFHYYPPISPDPDRRLLDKSQFINEHFNTTGFPVGHGFRRGGKGYYVIPSGRDELFQFICLDTIDAGRFGADGVIDNEQFAWLEQQLKACSSRYLVDANRDEVVIQPAVVDKLVIVFCHHTIATMTKNSPGKKGADLENLLLRFPNVIMLVNGHTHANNIWPHSPVVVNGANRHGFWEINTASHIDWPVQSRIIEVAEGNGILSIFTTMIDADAPLSYHGDLSTPMALASLGRELAANDPQEIDRGIEKRRGVTPDGRNTRLLLPVPFPIGDQGAVRVTVPDLTKNRDMTVVRQSYQPGVALLPGSDVDVRLGL